MTSRGTLFGKMDAVHVEMDSNSINSGYINDPPPQTEEQPVDGQMNVGRNLLEELKAERNALDPSFLHCARLLDKGSPCCYLAVFFIIYICCSVMQR